MKLGRAIEEYIAYRRALGEACRTNGYILTAFARSMGNDKPIGSVRPRQVRCFLDGDGPVTANWHGKFQALCRFYDHAVSRGYVKSSPLPKMVPKRAPPFVPYIYSRQALRSLLQACFRYQKKRSRTDPATIRTLLILLYGTGLRIREAIRLTIADVDLIERCLTVRKTKFCKSRLVPFGTQVARELSRHVAGRRHSQVPEQAPFFVTRDGRAFNKSTVEAIFGRIRDKAGVCRHDGARYQPRIHDLRHTFAVHRLIAWYRKGADVQAWLPVLSTYLGHAHLGATAVYLTMTPVLLDEANRRFQQYALSGKRQ